MARKNGSYTRPPAELPEEFTLARLMEYETFLEDAKRLRREFGVVQSGIAGQACPKCYREMVRNPGRMKRFCHCKDVEYMSDEVVTTALLGVLTRENLATKS